MKLTQRQEVAIDILLSTHRELTEFDFVEYKVEELSDREITLTIDYGHYYKYKILPCGAVVKMYKGEDGIKFRKVRYFTQD